MEQSASLIVKLPIKVCDTCTIVLSRWCEPTKPGWRSYDDYDRGTWTIDAKQLENRGNEPKWTWKVHELKSGALKCVCCQFLIQCLDASSWMVYGDEDYVQLKSCLVGSTHTNLHDRETEDNSLRYGNSSLSGSKYERFHRPRLQLYKDTKLDDEDGRRYAPGDYLFILPVAQSVGREGTNTASVFHGRLVGKNVDYTLVDHWFTICKNTHVKSELPKSRNYGSEVTECQPTPSRVIPNFRLIDINERRVVLAEPTQEYAALSYVWGNSKRLLLRNANLEQLSKPGALAHDNDSVPRTFRDAVAVAAALHLQYLWIDAVCIVQDDETQLLEHMNCMDQIYGAAVLTIVSDTTDAGNVIPGVGRPRGPAQATLQHGNTSFISSKRTFGRALFDSPWESRAWCLQEKVFSKRLLIFTETQAFYHCNCSTWFEDTVLEMTERNGGSVGIAERSSPFGKSGRPSYTAYEAHRRLFGRNFWKLVEIYSKRNLSFESDTIRAFSGILKSVEYDFGPAIWGVPQCAFVRGLTWSLSSYKPSLRRSEFPSWSWAGWRANTGSSLYFTNASTNYSDTWDVEWHHYRVREDGDFELVQIDDTMAVNAYGKRTKPRNPKRNRAPEVPTSLSESNNVADAEDADSGIYEEPAYPRTWGLSSSDYDKVMQEYNDKLKKYREGPEYRKRMEKYELQRKSNHTWMLSGHPKEQDYVELPIPPLAYDQTIMPPITHILRFYTSAATLVIDPLPDPDYQNPRHSMQVDHHTYHAIRLPDSGILLSHIELDPESQVAGRTVEFIYVSRGFHEPSDFHPGDEPQLLNIVMIEGEGEVKEKVQCCGMWDITQWRRAKPTWKLISLA